MANNPYVNRVQLADGTSLIDISDTTATADKILQGYTAYGADGSKLTGTATGGGGSVTQDQDGFIVLPPDGGGSPSVGGLVYETGTFVPTEDVLKPTISFTNTHTEPPMFAMMIDASATPTMETNTQYSFIYTDWYRLSGTGFPYSGTSDLRYGFFRGDVRSTSETSTTNSSSLFSYNSDETGSGSAIYPNYYVTSTEFKPSAGSTTSRYWRAGRTYKWIAVWAPTT